jgi:hypothetical protein
LGTASKDHVQAKGFSEAHVQHHTAQLQDDFHLATVRTDWNTREDFYVTSMPKSDGFHVFYK